MDCINIVLDGWLELLRCLVRRWKSTIRCVLALYTFVTVAVVCAFPMCAFCRKPPERVFA